MQTTINKTPMYLRRLRSRMELKGLTLRDVSTRANVPYTMASAILRGRLVHPEYLTRLRCAIGNRADTAASTSLSQTLQPTASI